MRGNLIVVRDYKNRALVRKIWEVTDNGVLVTTDDLFNLLENGDNAIFAIGFPGEDCFKYADSLREVDGKVIRWEELQPLF